MNKKILLILLLIISALLLTTGGSYAYYRFMRGVNGPVSASANTVDGLSISFQDGEFIGTENFVPGSSVTKYFSVTNDNNETVLFDVYLNDVVNTITRNNDLIYEVYDDNDTLLSSGTYPTTNAKIAADISLASNTTKTYHLVVNYVNSLEDQSVDIGFTFEGTVSLVRE